MSAAEKLRALEVTIKSPAPERPYITQEKASVRVENALPQIIAVLEAAELVRLTAPLPEVGQPGYAAWKSCERALAALDEALT